MRLDTQSLVQLGGDSGPGVVPNDLEESLIYNAITHTDFVMPPKRKLSPQIIADFRKWIEMGAPDPRVTKVEDIKSQITTGDIEHAKKTFWAYQQPSAPGTPSVGDASWAKTEIDRHVLTGLENADLSPASDAPSYKILRRLCFDLVGLPPTPEQIQWFEKAWAVDPDRAIATAADRLLDKELFGERWGRHWLDVARYAESTGREVNVTFPHAWRYRDYVIDSFNADKPFDEFIVEQIAGDLVPTQDDADWSENLVATTFLAMGSKNLNEQNGAQFRFDLVDEQIDVTTRVFLGTSVACARCHDHKFDPIRQTDYYAMAGIFASTKTFFGNPPSQYGRVQTPQMRRSSSLILLPVADANPFDKSYSASEMADLKEQIQEKYGELAELRRSGDRANAQRDRIRITNQLSQLTNKLSVVDENGKPLSYCMGVQEADQITDARVFVRGEIDKPAQQVRRGVPPVLSNDTLSIKPNSSGRLELARWIASENNPLTARVMVNRVWKHLIGQGIVTTTENFGATGASPSHPELLDHLAVEFVANGWSVKSLIRQIVTSRVYRMDTTFDERSHQYDPDNALVWRANPRRLDAESLRDAMLSISGELDTSRPRGSYVAENGFMRVRGDRLEDPREIARTTMQKVADQTREEFQKRMAEARRRGQQGFRGQGGLAQRFRQQGGRQQGFPGGNRPQGMRPQGASGQRDPGRSGGRPGGGMQSGRNNPMVRDAFAKVATQVAQETSLDRVDADYRSVYLPIVRDLVPRSLDVFDYGDSSMIVGNRETSNTPNQALYMMNNPLVIRLSESFADRLANNSSRMSDQIQQAFVLAYGRPPTSGERQASSQFLRSFASSDGASSSGRADRETLAAFCQSLFAATEFRYLD